MAYPMDKATLNAERAAALLTPTTAATPGELSLEQHAGPIHLAAEWTMTIVFPLVLGGALYLAGSHLQAKGWLWLLALLLPLGIVLGDFVSGFVHWAADSYFHYHTPVIGEAFIRPFRLHHAYPKDICSHNLVSIMGNTSILAAPIMSFCVYLLWDDEAPVWLAAGVFLNGIMAGATVLTNLFHKWAHLGEKAAPLVKWLQRKHLILPPDHHQVHHSEPFNRYYCITNGWVNPLLDKLNFFPRLESVLSKIGVKTTIDNP